MSAVWMTGAGVAQAQLLSPGPLTRAHQELEGFTNCTSCHTVGGRGVDRAKCLSCHESLKNRIEAGTGFHAEVDERCESCHHDHLGLDFDIVKLDESSFDHRETGYELLGAHLKIECRDCHKPELITAVDVRQLENGVDNLDDTFLGLPIQCADCHSKTNPHGNQFSAKPCSACHASTVWSEVATFSHAETDFPLTGLHTTVTCESCHKTPSEDSDEGIVRYADVEFGECSNCHADPHKQAFGVTCQQCHSSEGWGHISAAAQRNFSHTLTGFELLGAHSRLECSDCHAVPARHDGLISIKFKASGSNKAFRAIEHEFCGSCHVEMHKDQFSSEAASDCSECHTDRSWIPTSYDINRHNLQSLFPLAGAHEATPCGGCHGSIDGPPRFRFANSTCEGCHSSVNPHKSSFADEDGSTNCADCHNPSGWTDQSFDHASTGYPLVGKHVGPSCKSCHTSQTFELTDRTCASCHADRNPHGDQFETDCATCHDATGFMPVSPRFDHTLSRFALDGAHQNVPCQQCHEVKTSDSGKLYSQYVPTSPSCKDCHSDTP